MSGVNIKWVCSIPKKGTGPERQRNCEDAVVAMALQYGYDEVYIRHLPHDTTKIQGQYVHCDRHITVDFGHCSTGTWTPAHVYVNSDDTIMNRSPNPEFYETRHPIYGMMVGTSGA